MEKTKELKKYNLLQNLNFLFRHISAWDKWVCPVYIMKVILSIAMNNTFVFSVPVIVSLLIENGRNFEFVLKTIAVLSIVAILIGALLKYFNMIFAKKMDAVGDCFDELISKKIMNMDYDIIANPENSKILSRSKSFLDNNRILYTLLTFSNVLSRFVAFSVMLIIVFQFSPLVALILLGTLILPLFAEMFSDKLVAGTEGKGEELEQQLNYLVKATRNPQNIKDIRVYKLKDLFITLSDRYINQKKSLVNKTYLYYLISDGFKAMTDFCIKCCTYLYLAWLFIYKDLSITELILYTIVILNAKTSFLGFISEQGNLVSLNKRITDLKNFLALKNKRENLKGVPLPDQVPYKLEIKNVDFVYPGSKTPVLKRINLTIEPGEKVAIVGLSGTGKTTLLNLICGFYKPTRGEILLNGINISMFNRDEYYSVMSAVFQDSQILPATVAENVSMLPLDETDRDMVEKCIETSGFDSKVKKLKDGIETKLTGQINGEDALSGGEKQLLLLARSLYKKSSLLILDEPTNSLDPIAEKEIYLKYNEFTKNKTSIYVSHRLSSTVFCDKIVLLDENRIKETGTHNELIAAGGLYAQMYEVQKKNYEMAGDENDD